MLVLPINVLVSLPMSFLLSAMTFPFSHQQLSFFLFFKAHSWHIKVPRLGVESELHLPAYTPAAATQDPSRICYLHHSSWQHWVLNPLSLARDRTHILMDTNRVCNPLSHNKNSIISNSLIILKAQFK